MSGETSVNFVPSMDGSGWAGGPREDRSGQKRATSACRSAPCKTFGPAALMVHSHVHRSLRRVLTDRMVKPCLQCEDKVCSSNGRISSNRKSRRRHRSSSSSSSSAVGPTRGFEVT